MFHSCFQVFMPQQIPYLNNIYTIFKPVRCFCMTKLMCMRIQWYIRILLMGKKRVLFYSFIYCCFCQLVFFSTTNASIE